MIESLLLSAARVFTFQQQRLLTNASGFFFERGDQLFLVTSRHGLSDAPSNHFPDRIEIELHTDGDNMAASTGFSIPLYRDGKTLWRQGFDAAGEIDVALIEIERAALPATTAYRAFTPERLSGPLEQVEIGTPVLVVGFPLGFHDTLHHMPVVRWAAIAASFGGCGSRASAASSPMRALTVGPVARPSSRAFPSEIHRAATSPGCCSAFTGHGWM